MTQQPDQPLRILLIEDNELDARSMSRALTADRDVEVIRCDDLASGCESLAAEVFDCVLLDLSLPDSEGLAGVETVLDRAPHCPVVVLTGLDDPSMALAAVAGGAQDYLVKGIVTSDLVARAVRYAIARHSTEVELIASQRRIEGLETREQIARDLHDTVIQQLFAAGMSLEAGASLGSFDELADRVRRAVTTIDDAISELRRAIVGLYEDERDGDSTAFDELVAVMATFEEPLGFSPALTRQVEAGGVLSSASASLRADVVAVVREALTNIVKHADAASVGVAIVDDGARLEVRVTHRDIMSRSDDEAATAGSGPTDPDSRSGFGSSGNGLRNLRARAESHGGTSHFELDGAGSELVWRIPSPGV